MTKKLVIALFTLASAVSYAQIDDYEIETVEKNISKPNDADSEQDDYFKGSNESEESPNSPQINIYNANSNANKQHQKARQESGQDQSQRSSVDATTQADAGSEYVVRANEIRNNRKNMEVGTEQKMIEKIEWSRIEDEKDRADRLFGNRLDKKDDRYKDKYNENDYNDEYKKEEKVVVVEKPVYAQAAPVAVAPAPVYQNEYKEEETKKWWGNEAYIAPLVGTSNYIGTSNVRGNTAFGGLLGARLDSNIAIEASFLYSNYQMDDYTVGGINNPGLKDVTQYNFMTGLKYNFDLGRLSPHIGALLGYTYRQYDEKKFSQGSTNSNAFDAGLSAGADLKLAKNFSIGAEYRYMVNVTYDRSQSNPVINQAAVAGKDIRPLEEIGYQMVLVNGKFTF